MNRGVPVNEKRGWNASIGQWMGLGLSFGITMLVNIAIAAGVGLWLDHKLGTKNIFWLLGVLCGIYAGFHLFIEQVEQMENPIHPSERE